jgi:hypothetical protein
MNPSYLGYAVQFSYLNNYYYDGGIKEQQLKELWVFARAGSSSPNYYVCSKFWCATDQIPVLESEYNGDIMNNGAKKKLIPSCPYCGEQNVIERKDNNIYVGYFF